MPPMAIELKVDTDAEEVGFDAGRLERIDRHFTRYVEEGRLPGWLIVVTRRGRVTHLSRCGHADVESGRLVEVDTHTDCFPLIGRGLAGEIAQAATTPRGRAALTSR